MKNIFKVYLFTLLIGSSLGCKTTKKMSTSLPFGIQNLQCKNIPNPAAIDSKVGTLECPDISFYYDYGLYSNPGPITPREEFRRSFDAYHHIKFFEYRKLDSKVYKLFLDSVRIVEVREKLDSDDFFFECKPCNTTAVITFMRDTYYYPFTLSKNQLSMEDFSASFEERGRYLYKYYKEENKTPAFYATPIQNRFKKKNCLSLTVKETTLSDDKVDMLLKDIFFENNKNSTSSAKK